MLSTEPKSGLTFRNTKGFLERHKMDGQHKSAIIVPKVQGFDRSEKIFSKSPGHDSRCLKDNLPMMT